jgi:hypothetical protein
MTTSISDEQDEYLDTLLQYIGERSVVPIIGQGLLTVADGGEELPLYTVVARRLADALKIDPGPLSADLGLNDVVCSYLDKMGVKKRGMVYSTVQKIFEQIPFQPPPALQQLAEIRDFDLYISVTMDRLMEDALNHVRYADNPRAGSLAYAPNQPEDLPCKRQTLDVPVVYHLLGRVSALQNYVVCEEDMLEFMSALQSDVKRPNLLFDEIRKSHLLVLGCNLSNWLARFFLRAAKGQKLSIPSERVAAVVDAVTQQDHELVMFLGHFSPETWLMPWNPRQFVDELHRRWQARQPPPATVAAVRRGIPALAPGFVFISYSSNNLTQAEQLRRGLDEAGVDTWLDKEQLAGGDEWNSKIRDNIRRCAAFVPLLSQQVEARPEAYFRREWTAAIERKSGVADNQRFLLPVVLDDLPKDAPTVPEAFRTIHWSALPDGKPTPEFIALVEQLVRDYRRREKGSA